MNFFCKIGLHRWWPEINNIFTEYEVVYRTYMRCTRCKKWGKNIFFEKVL